MQPLSEAEKIQGWMNRTELEWLRKKALGLKGGSIAVALGAWRGRSVVAMAVDGVVLYVVDHFQGSPGDPTRELAEHEDIQAAFVGNMRRLSLNPMLIVADAVEAAAAFADGSIHFLFMDTDDADFQRIFYTWMPKIAHGGIYAGHDNTSAYPSIELTLKNSGIGVWGVIGTSIWWFHKVWQ